jgi:hypothetical protein
MEDIPQMIITMYLTWYPIETSLFLGPHDLFSASVLGDIEYPYFTYKIILSFQSCVLCVLNTMHYNAHYITPWLIPVTIFHQNWFR